ncbi:MAG: ABC transporter ATP-binding protein [Deltaproteobacteria bacterium]|uniref:ABC transporter ATP-binding protein n=1 Tax=Candidatus Zymogenus saltonus TaxID=2844893 RepID=A0A9D8KET8_9DELT|nr:ABC transporter ATP-binding protein [Candidatus Zymogenus saltonus]
MLQLIDVHTYYGKIEALKGISMKIGEGEIVTLIGSNGAGKSTTLMTICGITPARKGKILLEGINIERTPPDMIVSKGLSQVPEGRRIFPFLTVMENLRMGAYLRKKDSRLKTDFERLFRIFPILKDRKNQLGGTLSGGEQQMLAIARALMSNPRLLLLDEPSLGLAPLIVKEIFKTISEINKVNGTTILLVEQNAKMALQNSNRGYVLETGRIAMEDKSENLLENDAVKKAYLGEN